MARQAALLLLTVHGYEIPDHPVTNDFYRQALELDLRGKREYTEAVLAAMGSIGKMHFSRHKALLKLSDEALELADRHNIDERKLRPIVTLAQEFHAEILRRVIDFNLTTKQIEQLCSGERQAGTEESGLDRIPAPAMKIARVAQTTGSTSPQDIAHALLRQEEDVNLARARIQATGKLLSEAERYLTD
jgi:ParB family transcriptional regulator, chromosome partitioning protein